MSNDEQSKQIEELIAFNEELLKEIENRDQTIDQLKKMVKDAILLINPPESIDQKITKASNDYMSNCLLLSAKIKKDKRAAIFLLKMIKLRILQNEPITGGLATYLIAAIDNIVSHPKWVDVKKAFLLTGTAGKSHEVRKVGLAIESALNEGFKKHKDENKYGKSAYWKVASDLGLGVNKVEALYTAYRKPNLDIVQVEYEEKLSEQMKKLVSTCHSIRGELEDNIKVLEIRSLVPRSRSGGLAASRDKKD